ncbi:hypothetical protein VZO05_01110 [Aggregatilineales bacterium SYSU G02658]
MLPTVESSRSGAALLWAIALAGTVTLPSTVLMAQLAQVGMVLAAAVPLLYAAAFAVMSVFSGLAARVGSKETLIAAAGVSFAGLMVLTLAPRFDWLLIAQGAQGGALALGMQSYRQYRQQLGVASVSDRTVPLVALFGVINGLGMALLAWSGDLAPWSYWLELILLGCALALFTRAQPSDPLDAPLWTRPALADVRTLALFVLLASPAGLIAAVIPWQLVRFNAAHWVALPLLVWLLVAALAVATAGQRLWLLLRRWAGVMLVVGYALFTFGTWTGYVELVTSGAFLLGLVFGMHVSAHPPQSIHDEALAVLGMLVPGVLLTLVAQNSGVTVALIGYGLAGLLLWAAAHWWVRSEDAMDA